MADPAPPEAPSAAAAPVAAAVADPAADPAANSGAPPVAAPPEDAQPAEDAQLAAPPGPFSWLDPHPIFVIILVGPEEHPYGMQLDYLCARSKYYREYFRVHSSSDSIEYVVKLPDTPAEIFAYAQNYLYTGKVFPTLETLPPYEVLIQLWKLGHQLGIDGLCDATLEAMTECRRVTETIPSTPLLVQVWHDTPEDSSIRKLLLSWAAEYMRSSISRKEFAKSLPQEVLSELVVTMSSLDASPFPQGGKPLPEANPQGHHKNVHRIDLEEGETPAPTGIKKKARHSDILPNGSASTQPKPAATGKKPRTSLPAHKPPKKRSTVSFVSDQPFSTDQKMNFCADLLTRMLSGPGFWTRLVGPFKEPVDPHMDGVPDYLQKITRPMDLGTMKAKMDRHEYRDEQEFVGDMRQIFSNCYTYWTKKDPMWTACEKLEKTFEEKYSQMNKWISKMEGEEMA